MLCVVSGQTVVHWESSNARMTTLPRNWLSDIGWPNWLTSRKSGAGRAPREVPGSRLGLFIAAPLDPAVCEPDPEVCELAACPEPVSHPARPESPASTLIMATADSATCATCARNLFIATTAYCRSSPPITPPPSLQNTYPSVMSISIAH